MSIPLRITLWFTVALALALAAAGILVFTLLSRELQADVDSSIVNKAHDAALSIRYVNGQLSVPTTIMVPDSEFRAPIRYTEIRDPDWRDVWRSETLQDSELPILGETESNARQGLPTFENVMRSDQRVRVDTAPILVRDTIRGYV